MPFVKGHIGYNKGLKLKGEWRNCLRCGVRKWYNQARLDNGGGRYCSMACTNRANAIKGKKHWNYKGSLAYTAIHDWLHDNHGNPRCCVECGKQGEKVKGRWNIQWALIKGKQYARVFQNFMGLCARCHIEYDNTKIKGGWNKGKAWPEEVRQRISEGTKQGMRKYKARKIC